MTTTEHFIGRQANGDRMYVEIGLSTSNRNMTSVAHEKVGAGALRLTISGYVIPKGGRTAIAAGQCITEIYDVTTPAPGWSKRDIESLAACWIVYNLNDMNAGCEHINHEGQTCSVSGYRWGTNWLYRPIPQDVIKEITRLQSLPTGKIPSTY
jgi:hypothetical protein